MWAGHRNKRSPNYEFEQRACGPKLWATILGLLVVMMLFNLWGRSNTEQALEQAREDVQQIERNIALAQHMRGAAMTGLELGIAQFATNENRLQIELEKRFEQRRVAATEALQAMEAALHDDAYRAGAIRARPAGARRGADPACRGPPPARTTTGKPSDAAAPCAARRAPRDAGLLGLRRRTPGESPTISTCLLLPCTVSCLFCPSLPNTPCVPCCTTKCMPARRSRCKAPLRLRTW